MRNFGRSIFLVLACFNLGFNGLSIAFAQTNEQSKPAASGENQPKIRCPVPAVNKNGKRIYEVGTSISGSKDEKGNERRFKTLIIPKGENALAKSIRKAAIKRDEEQISNVQKALKIWLEAHPNATAEEIEEKRSQYLGIIDRIKNKTEIKRTTALPRWDWRELLSVGPVMHQGFECNTCWAFAATDAVAASFMKVTKDRINYNIHTPLEDGELWTTTNGGPPPFEFLEQSRPSVQDLLDCMLISPKEVCNSGWHGRAFDFFVNKNGVPIEVLGIEQKIDENGRVVRIPGKPFYESGKKFDCFPMKGFKKAFSWDYVNSPPDKVPTPKQLKMALIEHGPLVAGIFYDDCLNKYRSGVFNERNLGDANHVVLLVGWDDEKGDKGAWLIKNSWGEEWGEKGYAWVEYGSNNIGQYAAWVDANPEGASDLYFPGRF